MTNVNLNKCSETGFVRNHEGSPKRNMAVLSETIKEAKNAQRI